MQKKIIIAPPIIRGMNEALFNLGLDLQKKFADKPRKKVINKIIEKEREIQKLIYSIKHKITWYSDIQ